MAMSHVILLTAASTLAAPSPHAFTHDALFDQQMNQHIEISQVPQDVRIAATRELRGIGELRDALLLNYGGQLVYEFEAEDSVGATHVAWFTANGTPVVLGADEE